MYFIICPLDAFEGSSKLKLFYKQISMLLKENSQKINMDQPLEEKKRQKLRILVAPLDWGLGHATRCIPIIRELVEQGVDIWLAGEGQQ